MWWFYSLHQPSNSHFDKSNNVILMARRLGRRIRPPIIIGAIIATFFLIPGDAAGADCWPTHLGQRESWWGFTVTDKEEATTVSFLPLHPNWPNSPVRGDPGLFFTFEGIVQVLARRAQILPVFVSLPTACRAVDTPTSWTGESPLDVLKQLLEDCDLTVVIRGKFVIVANPEMIHTTAVVLSIGPVAGDALPPSTEEALYRDLYLHKFPLWYTYSSHSLYAVRIGYLPVPEDPNEYIVFAGTHEPMFGGRVKVIRARIVGGENPSVRCQWVVGAGGSPCPAFTEDIDGDGIQDILIDRRGQQFSYRDEMVPSKIVSGKSGKELFSFILGRMTIQRTQEGPIRISARTRDSHSAGDPCLPVFEFSSATRRYEMVAMTSDPNPESTACTNAAERLATTWNGPATIDVYDLHQCATTTHSRFMPSGQKSRGIPAAPPRTFLQIPFRIRGSDFVFEDTAESRTMLTYIPSGYAEAVVAKP